MIAQHTKEVVQLKTKTTKNQQKGQLNLGVSLKLADSCLK